MLFASIKEPVKALNLLLTFETVVALSFFQLLTKQARGNRMTIDTEGLANGEEQPHVKKVWQLLGKDQLIAMSSTLQHKERDEFRRCCRFSLKCRDSSPARQVRQRKHIAKREMGWAGCIGHEATPQTCTGPPASLSEHGKKCLALDDLHSSRRSGSIQHAILPTTCFMPSGFFRIGKKLSSVWQAAAPVRGSQAMHSGPSAQRGKPRPHAT